MLHSKGLVKTIDKNEEGTVVVVGTSEVLDRQNEIVVQDGLDIKNFMKTNPAALWGHNLDENRPPIGKVVKSWVEEAKKHKSRLFKVIFDLQDQFAAQIYRKVKEGFINTTSIGFLPLELDDNKYVKSELLELSFVPVPANPDAVVVMREMGIEPIELKDLYVSEKPFPNEHACRLRDPGDFQDGSFRSMSREHEGKKYRVILGRLKGEDTTTEQSYRYPKTIWEASEARSHCKGHKGSFEAAGEEGQEEMETKAVIPFHDYGMCSDGEAWDAGKEMREAKVEDLEKMCTWFDSEHDDIKSSYKLPHHRMMDKKAVWRGVAAAMGVLLGARGGADIPEGDRKGVYSHLKKHYAQFGKEAPDFKHIEDQVLAGLTDEVEAIFSDKLSQEIHDTRRDIRMISKRLKKGKRTPVRHELTKESLIDALRIVNQATNTALHIIREKGGEK